MSLDPARDKRNRKSLADHYLDAVICRLPENVLLLTGYWPLSSSAFVVFPRDGRVTLLPVETELYAIPDGAADSVMSYRKGVLGAPDPNLVVEQLLREAVRRAGLERARIGIELGYEAVAAGHTAAEVMVPAARTRSIIEAAAPGAALVDASLALSRAAARKTPREITRLRRANDVAAFGLAAFRTLYEPGRRESEVAAQVEATIMSRGIGFEGAREVRAWAQLMSGHDSARAYSLHPATSARVIEPGDLGVLELATMVDGYWSDLTRTQVAGSSPEQKQAEMYAAVQAASEAVLRGARTGMTGGDVDALARSVIEERGFGKLFVHLTGHGLGFRYHEPHPTLAPGNRDAVEDGMVSSVEPGLYLEGFGGMRLEQNVAFMRDTLQLLSNAPIELTAQ